MKKVKKDEDRWIEGEVEQKKRKKNKFNEFNIWIPW